MIWTWRLLEEACTGCGICADVCRPGAVRMTPEMPFPEPVAGGCVGCMICVRECPFEALIVERTPVATSGSRASGR